MPKEFWKPGTMIYPLPVVLVTVGDFINNQDMNIITVAWTGTICTNPAMAYISVTPQRYSYGILKKYKSFVINIATKNMARAVDYCGVKSGRDVDKFKQTGLTAAKSNIVTPPSILESPINIECEVADILPLGSHHMFIANVAGVAADDKYMDEKGRFCLEKSEPIAYSHGSYHALAENLGKFGFSVKK